jgi:hypothetical protein
MYSFMLDQSYINLFILVIIVAIVMFLWRKLIILEGNFFVLEKRVNLIKKDAREDSIAKNIDKADIIMNEIFKDFSPSNACKQSMCGGVGGSGSGKAVCETSEAGDADDDEDICYLQKGGAYNIPIGESRSGVDPDIITFVNGGNVEIDMGAASSSGVSGAVDEVNEVNEVDALAALATTISSSEEYENKMRIADVVVMDAATDAADAADAADTDTMSVCSEITFTSDDKKSDNALKKKYVKMSLDKLKDVCMSFNISGEGTRNELINRIIKVKN